jgi:hypothetical protein
MHTPEHCLLAATTLLGLSVALHLYLTHRRDFSPLVASLYERKQASTNASVVLQLTCCYKPHSACGGQKKLEFVKFHFKLCQNEPESKSSDLQFTNSANETVSSEVPPASTVNTTKRKMMFNDLKVFFSARVETL